MPVCTQQHPSPWQAVESAHVHPKLPGARQGRADSPQPGQGQNTAIHAYSDKDDAGWCWMLKWLERVAQRGSGGPIPGNIQGQVGQGSEQPDVVSGVPARCGGAGLDDL